MKRERLPNYTRESASIPGRLWREGKPHLIPLYGLMLTSDLAREGILRSGSFRFADHVYVGRASGRLGIGRLLDAVLLRLPAARSFRNRYRHSRDMLVAEAQRLAADRPGEIRLVSAPCGIARELVEARASLDAAGIGDRVRFIGIDLDPEPLALSARLAGDDARFTFIRGDAFDAAVYPEACDAIASTGLADFLDDAEAVRFYETCRRALRPGGLLATSSQQPQPLADYLMRELAELRAIYRSADELHALLQRAGFPEIAIRRDAVGFQLLATARAPR